MAGFVVRNLLTSHGVEAAEGFQKLLVSVSLHGFKSLNKGLDYNFNGLFTGCVDWRHLSCQVNSHLPVSCLAYSNTHTKKEIKKEKATPQPQGVSALGNFFEQRCNLAFLPERKCRVMLQRGPSPHSAASWEKGGGQKENAKDLWDAFTLFICRKQTWSLTAAVFSRDKTGPSFAPDPAAGCSVQEPSHPVAKENKCSSLASVGACPCHPPPGKGSRHGGGFSFQPSAIESRECGEHGANHSRTDGSACGWISRGAGLGC